MISSYEPALLMQEDILQCKINNALRIINAPSHDTSYAHAGWQKENDICNLGQWLMVKLKVKTQPTLIINEMK